MNTIQTTPTTLSLIMACLMTIGASADPIYDENFTGYTATDTGIFDDVGSTARFNIDYLVGGIAAVGNLWTAQNNNEDIDFSGGNLNYGLDRAYTRTILTTIDLSTVAAGNLTFSYDVTSFSMSDGTARWGLFEGNNLNVAGGTGSLTLDVSNNDTSTVLPVKTAGTATFNQIGGFTTITGTGTGQTINFTTSEGGAAGDYLVLALTLQRASSPGNATAANLTIDNLEITNAIPEPSTLALLSMAAMVLATHRLRMTRN